MYTWCAVQIWFVGNANLTGQLTPRSRRSRAHRLALYMKLFIVMGISWTFEPISGAFQVHSVVWLITDYVNALQGVLILLLLVVFRKKARIGLIQRLPFFAKCCPHQDRITELADEDSEDSIDDEDFNRDNALTQEQPLTYNELQQ